MNLRDWLLGLGTLATCYMIGRKLQSKSPVVAPEMLKQPEPQTTQPKLTREDVIRLIATHNGPEGLDLSGYDLSNTNLKGMDLQGVIFSSHDFSNASFQSSNLSGTNFHSSNLARAYLAYTDIRGADFSQAKLCEASLLAAQAQDTIFPKADLSRADLYGCQLAGANLWYANLNSANLAVSRIADAYITGIQLGNSLIQEQMDAYEEYFERWFVSKLPIEIKEQHLSQRYKEAAEICMHLKNAYLSHGLYSEASWAYLKERRMRRATYAPWRARWYHGESVAQNPGFLRWRWVWFYLKYTWRWFFDWLTDLTSGYGEKPLRTAWLVLLILLVFPWLYWLSGQVTLTDNTPLQWIDYLIYSLGAFTTMDFTRFATTGWMAETLASVEALLGISILALLMFALGNRISRS